MFKSMVLNSVLGAVQRWENAMKKRKIRIYTKTAY